MVRVAADHDSALQRDPDARAVRLPHQVFETLRVGLASGPVLVQVPRAGYVPSVACQGCRAPGRCPRCAQGLRVKQPRVLCQLLQGLWLHGIQELTGIDQPIKATSNRPSTGGQVKRRRHAGHGGHHTRSLRAHFFSPTQKCVSAQGNTHGQDGPRMLLAQARQNPSNLFKIARVVRAGAVVQFATAAAKVGHSIVKPLHTGKFGKCLRVVTGG